MYPGKMRGVLELQCIAYALKDYKQIVIWLLWKTSSDWLKQAYTGCDRSWYQTVMSSGQDNIVSADREPKIDWTKSSQGDITFVTLDRELK